MEKLLKPDLTVRVGLEKLEERTYDRLVGGHI